MGPGLALARSLGGAEHRLQLAVRRLGLNVVVAPEVLASHEDIGHRPLPSNLEERGLDSRSILVLVQLDGADLLCAELGEECLDLGAEWAVRLGEDDHLNAG